MKVANFSQFPKCISFVCLRTASYTSLCNVPYCRFHKWSIDRPIWSGPVFGTLPAAASTPRMAPR